MQIGIEIIPRRYKEEAVVRVESEVSISWTASGDNDLVSPDIYLLNVCISYYAFFDILLTALLDIPLWKVRDEIAAFLAR